MFWLSVATLAAAIVPLEMFDAFSDVKEAPDPLNVVAVHVPIPLTSPPKVAPPAANVMSGSLALPSLVVNLNSSVPLVEVLAP